MQYVPEMSHFIIICTNPVSSFTLPAQILVSSLSASQSISLSSGIPSPEMEEIPEFVMQFRLLNLQLLHQLHVALLHALLLGGNHEEENRIPLDVAEEAQTDAPALVRTLDDARDVRHHE